MCENWLKLIVKNASFLLVLKHKVTILFERWNAKGVIFKTVYKCPAFFGGSSTRISNIHATLTASQTVYTCFRRERKDSQSSAESDFLARLYALYFFLRAFLVLTSTHGMFFLEDTILDGICLSMVVVILVLKSDHSSSIEHWSVAISRKSLLISDRSL